MQLYTKQRSAFGVLSINLDKWAFIIESSKYYDEKSH